MLIHGADVEERQRWVDRRDDAPDFRSKRQRIARRLDEERAVPPGHWVGEIQPAPGFRGLAGAIEPRDQPPPPSVVTIGPGMTMAAIERAAIEAALRETRGNRRKAAELLGIGERTLYRKLREYQLLVDTSALD